MSEALSLETRRQNEAFLLHKLRSSENHRIVEETFRTSTPPRLSRLLRDHKSDGVSDPAEIAFRRTMDHWLGEVGLLYEAWLSGYVLDPGSWQDAGWLPELLARTELRAYYERYYPIALPWLLRLHLEGKLRLEAAESSEAAGAFERFSILYERFHGDPALDQLLDFLDGFGYGPPEARIGIEAVVKAFAEPGRVAEALTRTAGQTTRLDLGLVGLVRFLTFSNDLDQLLRRCAGMPLVQSAFWYFYAYWFNEFQVDVAETSIEVIEKVVAASTDDDGARAELKAVMRRLTSATYAAPLLARLRERSIDFTVAAPLTHLPLDVAEDSPEKWVRRFERYAAKPSAPRE